MKLQFSGIKAFLWLIACCSTLYTAAQQSHFMYIQSDNKAPFSVTVDNSTQYSSNGTGYLIVPKIAKGKHQVNIGFADNKYPVQSFSVEISDSDMGYALKDYGEKGWGLFNLQTMGVIMAKAGAQPAATALVAVTKPAASDGTAKATAGKPAVTSQPVKSTATTPEPAGNQFGDMLSQVVGDPTLQQKPAVVVKNPAAPATANAQNTSGKTPTTPQTPVAIAPAETKPVADSEATAATQVPDDAWDAAATRGVIKASEQVGKEGFGYTFIDFNAKGADTVRIFIPSAADTDELADATIKMMDSIASAPKETENAAANKTNTGKKTEAGKKKDPVFVDTHAAAAPGTGSETSVSNPFYTKPAGKSSDPEDKPGNNEKPKATVTAGEEKEAVEKEAQPIAAVSYNSNCTGGMAAVKDMEKLKKKMVSEDTDDKMVATARKGFKSKCYTTEQIKELGRLFYTDESRYKFYDAAYPFVYDVTNFQSLETMLLDDYYKKRFRAMLRL